MTAGACVNVATSAGPRRGRIVQVVDLGTETPFYVISYGITRNDRALVAGRDVTAVPARSWNA
jgi:hypothetical protein